jgi:hypothetical protein
MTPGSKRPCTAQQLADLFSVLAPAFLKCQYAGILVEGISVGLGSTGGRPAQAVGSCRRTSTSSRISAWG